MNTFPMNDDWTVEYFQPEIDGFEMAPSVQPVPRLPDWRFEVRFAQAGFYAWLQRRFDLTPTDYCVRYIVQVENVPGPTVIYVNDQQLAEVASGTARVDMTDYVSLGKNRLNLRVSGAGAGRFDAVLLLQAACNEV